MRTTLTPCRANCVLCEGVCCVSVKGVLCNLCEVCKVRGVR